jgi:hypothetical protein
MKKLYFFLSILAFILVASACEPVDDGPVNMVDFTYSCNNYMAPCRVLFYNQSVRGQTFFWEFGDGTTSVLENPDHVYYDPGYYTVRLTAMNGRDTNHLSRTVVIQNPPTVCRITGVAIENCPVTSGIGISLDIGSDPDFFFNLENTSGTILFNGSSIRQTDNANFPVIWDLSPYINIPSNAFNAVFRIHIWDYDLLDANDDVSFVEFVTADFMTPYNHYPNEFNLYNGSTQVRVGVIWE